MMAAALRASARARPEVRGLQVGEDVQLVRDRVHHEEGHDEVQRLDLPVVADAGDGEQRDEPDDVPGLDHRGQEHDGGERQGEPAHQAVVVTAENLPGDDPDGEQLAGVERPFGQAPAVEPERVGDGGDDQAHQAPRARTRSRCCPGRTAR